jgi:two-component system cell cycle response regulator
LATLRARNAGTTTLPLPITEVNASEHRTMRIPTLWVASRNVPLQFARISLNQALTLGRDRRCSQFTLNDPSLSRRHARVHALADGRVLIEDLGSTNGTRVNGRRIDSAVALQHGDMVHVGSLHLRYEHLSPSELEDLRRLHAQVQQAKRDTLTQLATRDLLTQDIPALCKRADLHNEELTCIFLDVDHFKTVNDTWGHTVGDRVLQRIAHQLQGAIRDGDRAIRYGGEEFLIVLPQTSMANAHRIAERMRQTIASRDWDDLATGLSITISAGISQRLKGENISAWIQRADAQLYRAKTGGRNQICVDPKRTTHRATP